MSPTPNTDSQISDSQQVLQQLIDAFTHTGTSSLKSRSERYFFASSMIVCLSVRRRCMMAHASSQSRPDIKLASDLVPTRSALNTNSRAYQ